MKHLVLVAGLLVSMVASEAHAESWKCTYNGTWKSTADGGGGGFAWVLHWSSDRTSWHLLGDYADKFGTSVLDGTCANFQCKLTQFYKTGSLKGKTYYWQGSYKDKMEGANRSINTFVGTWGDSPAHRANGGPWSARAVCNRT